MAAQESTLSEEDIVNMLNSFIIDQPDNSQNHLAAAKNQNAFHAENITSQFTSQNGPSIKAEIQVHNANLAKQDSEGDVAMEEPDFSYPTGSQQYDPRQHYQLPPYRQTQTQYGNQFGPSRDMEQAAHGNHQHYGPERPLRQQMNRQNMSTFVNSAQPYHHHHHQQQSHQYQQQHQQLQNQPIEQQPNQQHQALQDQQDQQQKGRQQTHRPQEAFGQSSSTTGPSVAGVGANVATTSRAAPQRDQERASLKPRVGRKARKAIQRAKRNEQESARRAAIVEKMIKDGVLRYT